MDNIGSIKDPTVYVRPSEKFREYLITLERTDDLPASISRIIKEDECDKTDDTPKLSVSDVEWVMRHLEKTDYEDRTVYLHELMQDSVIDLPENEIIKRNQQLEARCVKLRKNQMNREYRSMTKNVDNVRVKQPEETIAYQMKSLNKQLVAVLQFVVSVASGFLFGFVGVQLMIGKLDFGFRLLLGVMCALIIALAEIYFLAKKLNEDINITETIQLGGPPVYPDEKKKIN